MAERQTRLYDPQEVQAIVPCPTCGQRYDIQGVIMRDGQQLACSKCNTIFTLRLQDGKVTAHTDIAYQGSPIGPAEGPIRQ